MNGIKSNNSTSVYQEERRHDSHTRAKAYFKTRKKFGTIKKVHEDLYAAVITLKNGGLANGGQFVPIKNPWQQLIHNFGPLRKGLLVEITFEGDQDSHPTAEVVGLEDEEIAQKTERADKTLALYEIFSPGI